MALAGRIILTMDMMHYSSVDEEQVRIALPGDDGTYIYGLLRGELTQPVVIIMHGRNGDNNALLPYLGARYLYEHGFASLRINMYGMQDDARDMVDTTIQTHADDFDAVVAWLRAQGATRLYAAGHSYGGITVLKAASKLDGAILWDPSHGLAWQGEVYERWRPKHPVETDDLYISTDGAGMVVSRRSHTQDLSLGDTSDWAAGKGYPLKIIAADRGIGILTEFCERYHAAADAPKAFVEIKGASHGFDDSDAIMMLLLKETLNWLKECEDGRNR